MVEENQKAETENLKRNSSKEKNEEKEEEGNVIPSFIFTISEPTKKPKEGITLSYWVYNIKVQTTLENYKEKEFNVRPKYKVLIIIF